MTHPETHEVTLENGPRPAGKPHLCFYCQQPLLSPHKDDCVLRKRTVVVRMTVEYAIWSPEYEDKDGLEFRLNEGTWCSNNAIDDLSKIRCICPITTFEYVREATEKDEEWLVKE